MYLNIFLTQNVQVSCYNSAIYQQVSQAQAGSM